MSDLDDLGDIADQTAFGRGRSRHGAPSRGHRPHLARCNSPDHMKGENIRIYAVKGKKTRAVCKLCDKARKQKTTYSAQGYPL